MPEAILYEFDGFRLDPSRGVLLFGGAPTELSAKPFKLLLTLVENHGKSVTKEELMRRVWPGSLVTDDNFHVNLNKVRKALGESASNPHFIFRTDDGYKFVADVKVLSIDAEGLVTDQGSLRAEPNEVSQVTSDERRGDSRVVSELTRTPSKHLAHILMSCALYGALYGSAVVLEVAYEFDRFGSSALKILPLVFSWITLTSAAGLMADQKLTIQGRTGGIVVSILIFFASAAIVFAGITFLPSSPITVAGFQTYPAQAAYLKDIVYLLVVVFLFLILPFHFVSTMEREFQLEHYGSVLDTLTVKGSAGLPRGTIYPRFWVLALLLLMFAGVSIWMAAHLFDNLKPGTYRNLFTQLVYLRGILYFGIGVECLAWYYIALNNLKRECLTQSAGSNGY